MEEWPLRGRVGEVARLTELLQDPACRGVLLSGAQGVGKTRLAWECLRIARGRGMATEHISATYATSVLPLGAVILARPAQEALAASPMQQTELVHRVASELVRQAGGRRLVLFVDDVHWLDQLSAVMVHQLVVTGAAFVVLTSRTGAAAPDPIVALWKDNVVERIPVTAVAREAIETLLVDALGGPVAGAAVADLADRSEGNLLYLREQILASAEDGSLAQDAGVWQLRAHGGAQPRLVELIEFRLAGLPSEERECLEVIAFGEPLELTDVLALVGEDLVRRLEHKGMLSVRPDNWGGAKVLLAHPLVGEVLRAETTVMRARQATSLLASTTEARGSSRPDDHLRIASWRLVCGGGEPDLMLRAATSAFARRDYDLTVRLAQGAVAAGAGFTARLLHAEASGFAGRRRQAEAELAALAADTSHPEHVAAIAHARMVNAYLNSDLALAGHIYREALRTIDDPSWRAELSARRAWLVVVNGGPREGLRFTEEIRAETQSGSPLVATALVRTAALGRSGRVTEALECARNARAEHERLTEHFDFHPATHDFVACEALAIAGRWREWREKAQSNYDSAVAERSAAMQLYFAYQLAKVSLAQGRVRTAARLAGEAVGIAHQINELVLLQAGLTTLAEASAVSGDIAAAERALAELESMRQNPWFLTEPGVARAWLMVAHGDLVSAHRTLEHEVDRGLSVDDLRLASLALHSLVRIGEARVVGERLESVAARVEGDLAPLLARHALAAARRDGVALEKVGAEFLDLTATLLAAEAYGDGAGAFRAAGDPRRAMALAQKSALLVAQCEGARTPASRTLVELPELTQAERRTALLAAHGRSNRQIADAEQISIRTAESRLQCVYTKLGISSRKALADLLDADFDASS